MNWVIIFNRLFEIINTEGDSYYSGTRFLKSIREVSYDMPSYTEYIEQRRNNNKSTSRKDYYFDALMAQKEDDRIKIVSNILDTVEHLSTEKSSAIRVIINPTQTNQVTAPTAEIPEDIWNAERLIEYMENLDSSITKGNYEHTLTLAYTCLEGFFKSFIKEKIPSQEHLRELTPMSVQIRNYIKTELETNNIAYPEQTIILISTVTNAICNARNNFSDSHSANRAEKWLAIYLRDNVNALVRLILNFI